DALQPRHLEPVGVLEVLHQPGNRFRFVELQERRGGPLRAVFRRCQLGCHFLGRLFLGGLLLLIDRFLLGHDSLSHSSAGCSALPASALPSSELPSSARVSVVPAPQRWATISVPLLAMRTFLPSWTLMRTRVGLPFCGSMGIT